MKLFEKRRNIFFFSKFKPVLEMPAGVFLLKCVQFPESSEYFGFPPLTKKTPEDLEQIDRISLEYAEKNIYVRKKKKELFPFMETFFLTV